MRKGFMGIISLALIFCLVLAGCGSAQAKDSVSEEASESSAETAEEQDTPEVASEQDTPEVTQQEADQQAAEGEETMTANEQTTPEVVQTQEIWVQNGDDRIYGVAYVPAAEDGKKVPLVIFSHELGNDHTSGERYAERLAEAGYAAYVFDFRGGTVGGNRSDGSNSEMSILTEASDLESVLAAAKTWDFVDPDKIVLLGGSMGGLVTTVVGSTHQDEIPRTMFRKMSACLAAGSTLAKTTSPICGRWILTSCSLPIRGTCCFFTETKTTLFRFLIPRRPERSFRTANSM